MDTGRLPVKPAVKVLTRPLRIARIVGMLACGLVLSACATGGTGSGAGGSVGKEPLRVVASTDVWGSVAAAVGGDDVRVSSLIDDPAKDPHDYRTTPADAVRVHNAALVVYNGGGYDDFFAKALHAAGGHKEAVVAFDLSGRRATPETNEHVFYDLPTVRRVAEAIARDLGDAEPSKRRTFQANAAAFGAGVDALAARVRAIGTDHPGKRVLATEDVADYLLSAAGVTDATPRDFAAATEKDSAVSAAAMRQTMSVLTGRKVDALIDNVQTASTTTNRLLTLAHQAGIPVVPVTETLPAGEHDYLTWMGAQVTALARALER